MHFLLPNNSTEATNSNYKNETILERFLKTAESMVEKERKEINKAAYSQCVHDYAAAPPTT